MLATRDGGQEICYFYSGRSGGTSYDFGESKDFCERIGRTT